MESKPTPGRVVQYFPAPEGEDGMNTAFGEKYAAAMITGVIDADQGYVNLIVYPDRQEPVIRTQIVKNGMRPISGSRIGANWDWPSRV